MGKYNITVYTQLSNNNYISERTFICKSQYMAKKLINEYAVKENTVDIEVEELKWNI